MISSIQALILGLIQGITELFPISSLGHSVVLPRLFGWNISQSDNYFLIFLVATHLATSLVLLGFFWKDWVKIVRGIFRSLKNRSVENQDTYAKLGWLIIVSTIPAGLLGLLFEKKLKDLFASPRMVAIFLILNGVMLLASEFLVIKKNTHINQSPIEKSDDEEISKLSWDAAVKVGLAQCLALIPGFSRTGSTLGGGLIVGLNHERAVRYSFLLATPIIFAAAVLKLPELLQQQSGPLNVFIGPLVIGVISAAVAAFFSVKFLTKYFETKTLKPFAIYCIVAGILLSIIFLFR